METFVGIIILMIIFVAIIVAISRWIFRINDIVEILESINTKLNGLTVANPKQPVFINPEMPCSKCGHKPMKVITKVDGSKGIECPACRSFYPTS